MVTAVFLSISAQVVEAEQSLIGWIAAAIPALGFLVMVKIAMAQSRTPVDEAGPSALLPSEPESERAEETPDAVVLTMIEPARSAADEIARGGRRLTRETLLEVLRDHGYAVSNARASALVAILKAERSESTAARPRNRREVVSMT